MKLTAATVDKMQPTDRRQEIPVPSRTITLTFGDLPFSWQDRF